MIDRLAHFNLHVGRKLRELRVSNGDSQQQLARKCSLTFQQIQKYEKGVNQLSYFRAYEIANIYNAPITYFIDGLNEK